MDRYDADRHCWSGLGSGPIPAWQAGLRRVCRHAGDFQFHSSLSGFDGWERVAASAIRRRPRRMILMGHSNGGYAITAIAEALEAHGIECVLVCFDRTLKPCPQIGSNVIAALDLWAQLSNLKRSPSFKGELVRRDFSHLSHIGVIGDPDAQRAAIDFIKEWS